MSKPSVLLLEEVGDRDRMLETLPDAGKLESVEGHFLPILQMKGNSRVIQGQAIQEQFKSDSRAKGQKVGPQKIRTKSERASQDKPSASPWAKRLVKKTQK